MLCVPEDGCPVRKPISDQRAALALTAALARWKTSDGSLLRKKFPLSPKPFHRAPWPPPTQKTMAAAEHASGIIDTRENTDIIFTAAPSTSPTPYLSAGF